MLPTEQLQALFRSGVAGNQADYARFLQGVTPYLTRIIARFIEHGARDDVVQEILISIHKARHTYDGVRPLAPWLAAIARYRMMDYLRRHYAKRQHQMVDIAEMESVLADVTGDTDPSESIDDLLQGVTERPRQILTMLHVEGYTAKEVGQRMNMSESAVKVAAHRAVKAIRKRLGL